MRGVKTPDELERIGKAIKISDKGQEFARNLVECGDGLTEREVRSEIDYFMARCGVQENSFSTIIASGPNAAHSHHSNTIRKLEKGDSVICDFGVFWDGYCSDITRTYFVGGEASKELTDIYQIVLKANEKSINALTKGNTGHNIDKAGSEFIRSKDYGDLYIRVVTEVPTSLTREQKSLLEQFKKLEDTKSNPTIKNFFEKAKRFWKN